MIYCTRNQKSYENKNFFGGFYYEKSSCHLCGNKWKLLILRNLIYNGAQRFTDFPKTIPGISKKVLTDNLRALESDGLIEREVFAEVPPRVVYSLSELGKTLKPILDAMFDWGTDYKNSL